MVPSKEGLIYTSFRYLRTMLFGVYLLIRKRAVLRYIFRLLAVYVSLLANIRVFYHSFKQCQQKNDQKSTFFGHPESLLVLDRKPDVFIQHYSSSSHHKLG